MFYLAQFFKALKIAPVRGGLFLISTFLLLISLGEMDALEKKYFHSENARMTGAYFYALISSKENNLAVARKLRVLPGVEQAITLSEKKIKLEVERLLGAFKKDLATELQDELHNELKNDLINLEFTGIKVVFQENITQRTQQLIRDYLSRLVGTDKVTLGPIKKPNEEFKKNAQLALFLKDWGIIGVVFLCVLFWFSSLQIFSKVIAKQSYLLEQFQRKKFVRIKILGVGPLLALAFGPLVMFIFGQPQEVNLLFFTGIACLGLMTQLRKSTWNT